METKSTFQSANVADTKRSQDVEKLFSVANDIQGIATQCQQIANLYGSPSGNVAIMLTACDEFCQALQLIAEHIAGSESIDGCDFMAVRDRINCGID